MSTSTSTQIPHVVILGAGFGGVKALKETEGLPINVTLIDHNNYHLFQPLLYQAATSGITPFEIGYPIRKMLRDRKNARFVLGHVRDIDTANRKLITNKEDIPYDYLIVAPGAVTNFFGMESVAQHSFDLKDLPGTEELRVHLLRQFEAASRETDPVLRRRMLTVVVVGGGPTGVETAGAVSELYGDVLAKDYPNMPMDEMHIILVEALDRLLLMMPVELSENAAQVLRRKGVDVRFGKMVTGYDGETLTFKDGETLETNTLIWAAGARAEDVVDSLGGEQDRMNRIKVTPTLQLPGHPEVFVIGDAAHFEENGEALGMIAPVAMQQAELSIKNIMHLIRGESLEEFHFKDLGLMATIGRNAAVAQKGNIKMTGFMAWMAWLVIHLRSLVGFRNKLLVVINWFWQYLFVDRGVRIFGLRQDERDLVQVKEPVGE
jgi:NADH dehydrogenase